MPVVRQLPTMRSMSYAVLWSDEGHTMHVGKLELRDGLLVLDGVNAAGRTRCYVAVADVVSSRIGRSRGERLGGRPALLLHLARGSTVRIAMLAGVGALHEIVDYVGGTDRRASGHPQARVAR